MPDKTRKAGHIRCGRGRSIRLFFLFLPLSLPPFLIGKNRLIIYMKKMNVRFP